MGTDRRGAAAAAPHTTAPFANQTGGRSLTLPRLSLNPVLLYYWTTSYDARVRLVRLHRPRPRRKWLEPLPVAAAGARGAAPPSGRGRARAHGRRSLTPKSAGTAPAAAGTPRRHSWGEAGEEAGRGLITSPEIQELQRYRSCLTDRKVYLQSSSLSKLALNSKVPDDSV